MIPEETNDKKILTKEERMNILNKKIEKIKEVKEWAGDLEISGICIMLNINIILYNKDDMLYKQYFKFEGSNDPNECIDMLYVNLNNFNLLFKKNKVFKLNNIISGKNAEQIKNNNEWNKIDNKKECNEKLFVNDTLIKNIINKYPDKNYVKKNYNSNINNIGKGIYVDYVKNIYILINITIFLNIYLIINMFQKDLVKKKIKVKKNS